MIYCWHWGFRSHYTYWLKCLCLASICSASLTIKGWICQRQNAQRYAQKFTIFKRSSVPESVTHMFFLCVTAGKQIFWKHLNFPFFRIPCVSNKIWFGLSRHVVTQRNHKKDLQCLGFKIQTVLYSFPHLHIKNFASNTCTALSHLPAKQMSLRMIRCFYLGKVFVSISQNVKCY